MNVDFIICCICFHLSSGDLLCLALVSEKIVDGVELMNGICEYDM